MVSIAGYELKDWQIILLAVAGAFTLAIPTLYFATPGPLTMDSLGVESTFARTQVLLGTATVAEAQETTLSVTDSEITKSGTVFGTFDEPGADINPGETVDYCADVEFKTTTDADYTYIGTYLSTADFDFPQEGETEWSDYHLVGSTVEICMPFTAPGGGTYDMSMWLDSISERAYEEGRIDEDTFEVVGETDSPPQIEDMNCPSSAAVGETVTISPDVEDDTGISRWYWDATGHYGNAGDDTAFYDWDSAGSKTVELVVTDQAGQTDRDSCTIDVSEDTQETGAVDLDVSFIEAVVASITG